MNCTEEWFEWSQEFGYAERMEFSERSEKCIEFKVNIIKDVEDTLAALYLMLNETRSKTGVSSLYCEDEDARQKRRPEKVTRSSENDIPLSDTYSTLTLNCDVPSAIASILKKKKYVSIISPAKDGYTIVYDTTDSGDDAAAFLSEELKCTALRVTNVKNDVLIIDVYTNGKAVLHYNSNPDYFSFDERHSPPQGTDSAGLCQAFRWAYVKGGTGSD